MKDIFRQSIEVLESGGSYSQFYMDNLDSIVDSVSKYSGHKTDIYLDKNEDELDYIRFSAIFSDLSNVYLDLRKSGHISIFKEQRRVFVDDRIARIIAQEHAFPILYSGTVSRSQEEIEIFYREVSPLVHSGRIMIHNPRIIASVDANPASKNSPICFHVNPNSASDNWIASEFSRESDSIAVVNSISPHAQKAFNITLPYFRNIKLKVLDKILDDNQDVLGVFRSNIRKITKEVDQDGFDWNEFSNDVIRPQIETINRKFRKISNSYRLKNSVTIGSATIGLFVLPSLTIAQGISAFVSGIGLLTKSHLDYQKQVDELMDNPLYLLWKINKKR